MKHSATKLPVDEKCSWGTSYEFVAWLSASVKVTREKVGAWTFQEQLISFFFFPSFLVSSVFFLPYFPFLSLSFLLLMDNLLMAHNIHVSQCRAPPLLYVNVIQFSKAGL